MICKECKIEDKNNKTDQCSTCFMEELVKKGELRKFIDKDGNVVYTNNLYLKSPNEK